jgi:hypothetical protein
VSMSVLHCSLGYILIISGGPFSPRVDSLDLAEDRLGYSSKAPLGTSRLSVPLHKDAKTSEGLLDIKGFKHERLVLLGRPGGHVAPCGGNQAPNRSW